MTAKAVIIQFDFDTNTVRGTELVERRHPDDDVLARAHKRAAALRKEAAEGIGYVVGGNAAAEAYEPPSPQPGAVTIVLGDPWAAARMAD